MDDIIQKINRNLFNIYALFTRDPFVRYFSREKEFFCNGNYSTIGLITFDITDKNYSCVILSRDDSRQFRAENIVIDIPTIGKARNWISDNFNKDRIIFHDIESDFFDLFKILVKPEQIHPYFELLSNHIGYSSAKTVIEEISYHYKDIDGNFIEQFQSINGFDARLWEIYLFCFFREEDFYFKRNAYAPDFSVNKLGHEIEIEAVIISNKEKDPIKLKYEDFVPKSAEEINKHLKNEMPLKFGSALYDKLKKKYWEKDHVKGKPFIIAIADFHEPMAMTWSFPGLIYYLYGHKYEHYHNEDWELIVSPIKIDDFEKQTGAKVPAGFFFQPDTENISAIITSSTATISKFNRMGKQAGLGSERSTLIRSVTYHNFDKNAAVPKFARYQVDENCKELWSEGVSVFHNPNALIPLDRELFLSVAHHFFKDGNILSFYPEFFPYASFTENHVTTLQTDRKNTEDND